MAVYADEQSYEEMIQELKKFVEDVSEQCTIMSQAGEDCVDNTDGDPAAVKSYEKLQTCIADISSSISDVERIIIALQNELQEIRDGVEKVNKE